MQIFKSFILFGLIFSVLACSSKKAGDTAEPMSDSATIQYQFAYEFYQQGELIRALRSIIQAEEASPKNTDVKNLFGLILFRQAKFEKAETKFKEAIALDPKLSEVYNNLGTLYYQQKQYAKAEASLRQALANPLYLYPERIHNNLGLVYQARGDLDDALEQFERAINLKPDFYLPYQNLGKLWIQKENYKRAQPMLEEAVRLCSECSEPHYHLGEVLLKNDAKAKAVELFQKAYELDPRGYYGQLGKQFLLDGGEKKAK